MAQFAAIAGIVGTLVSAAGTIAAGAAQKQAADFQAEQLDQQAMEERAASQREAQQVRKERDFLLSRSQAVSAASGLGALDETVTDLAGDITQDAAVSEGMVRYGGEERAKGRRAQAAASRLEGRAAQTGSYFSAAGTILGGVGSFAKSFSQNRQTQTAVSYRYG